MGGWTGQGKDDIIWDGRVIAKNFEGDGSKLTGLPTPTYPISIANGGTNATSFNSGRIMFFDGTRLSDDTQLLWDSTNNILTIGNKLIGNYTGSTLNLIYLPLDQSNNGFRSSLFLGVAPANISHTSAQEGWRNTTLGISTGSALTTGFRNTFIGAESGNLCNSGSDNTSLGSNCLSALTTGTQNTAIGYNSLPALVGGNYNTAIGGSMTSNTYGTGNFGLGYGSLAGNASFSSCVAVGVNSLRSATGDNNIGIGSGAGRSITSGTNNTFIGHEAGYTSQTANVTNTTGIGAGAYTTVSNSIQLGNTSVTLVNTSGKIVCKGLESDGATIINESGADVDFRAEGDTDINLLYLDASTDRVGIGTATPAYKLGIVNSSNSVGGVHIENTGTNKNVLIMKGTKSTTASHPSISYDNAGFGLQQATSTADNSANFTFYTANGNDAGSIICRMVQHTTNQPKGDVVLATANGSTTLNPIISAMSNGDIYLGSGIAGYDQKITIDGETNDCVITWMEDEDYLKFDDSIDAEGDLFFTGEGSGLPYGSCWGNEIGWSQASAVQNTWYPISDTDMSDGQLNLVTHDGSGKLTISKAGRYLINYSLAMEGSIANDHLESGIYTSSAVVNDGRAHVELGRANAQYCLSGTAILDLASNATIEIAVRTTDANTPTINTDHLNITITQVGGT